MTTENQSEKRSKLTLGLKKMEGDQSKTTEGRNKLILGLRNKAAVIDQNSTNCWQIHIA
jgi:hypothetical protein